MDDEAAYPAHYVLLATQLAPSVLATMSTRARATQKTKRRKLLILSSLAVRPTLIGLRRMLRARTAL